MDARALERNEEMFATRIVSVIGLYPISIAAGEYQSGLPGVPKNPGEPGDSGGPGRVSDSASGGVPKNLIRCPEVWARPACRIRRDSLKRNCELRTLGAVLSEGLDRLRRHYACFKGAFARASEFSHIFRA